MTDILWTQVKTYTCNVMVNNFTQRQKLISWNLYCDSKMGIQWIKPDFL